MQPRDLEVRMDLNDKCGFLPRTQRLFLSCGAEPFVSPGFGASLQRASAAGVPSIRLVND